MASELSCMWKPLGRGRVPTAVKSFIFVDESGGKLDSRLLSELPWRVPDWLACFKSYGRSLVATGVSDSFGYRCLWLTWDFLGPQINFLTLFS